MIRVYETIDEIPWLRIRFKDDSKIGLIVESNDKDKIGTEYRSRVKPSENKHLLLSNKRYPKYFSLTTGHCIVKQFDDDYNVIIDSDDVRRIGQDANANTKLNHWIELHNYVEKVKCKDNRIRWNFACEIDADSIKELLQNNSEKLVSDNSPIDMKVVEEFLQKNNEQLGMKFDTGKLRYSLVPHIAFKGLAEVLTFGADQYAPNSWQTVPNGKERYLDALYRHIEAYRNGEILDSESGLSHLSHAMTNCAFLLHFQSEELNAKV